MENIFYDKNAEYKKAIEKVSEKFKYEKDLINVLNKILPAMLDTASYEEKQLFYKMLEHTPIVVLPKEDLEKKRNILEKYKENPNKHIIELEEDLGEYSLQEPEGAFSSEPILDENLNLIGTKQYLYVTAFDTNKTLYDGEKKLFELFGTGINVPHLIHELGHAWVSEKDQYNIDKNGILTQRVGTAELKYKLEKQNDGTYTKKKISQIGLMLEEGLNTNMEDEAVARYLNINEENINELYRSTLVPSSYRGLQSNITNWLQMKTSKNLVRRWRILGEESSKKKLNDVMEQTQEYERRSELFSEGKKKIELFNNPQSKRLEDLFQRRHDEFFPDKTNMSGIEILDNVLLQCYNIKVNQMYFMGRNNGLEYYKNIMQLISADGYYLINETGEKLKELDKKNIQK